MPLHWFQKDAVAAAVREVKAGGRATVVARPAPARQDKARTDGQLTDRQSALLDALHRHAETVAG
ncbi:hypothetical protein [Kitasatospora sp. NPDC056531]|uniref:hypothetical protein n=1 Tax=Kitasatospora sp. NPDC056531 TaxID=3345856 RepID=UPI0036B5BFF4